MALEDNKADLALLLSTYLIDHSHSDQTIFVDKLKDGLVEPLGCQSVYHM